MCQHVRMDRQTDEAAETPRAATRTERRVRWLSAAGALVLGAGAATAVFLLRANDDGGAAAKPWVPPAAESPRSGSSPRLDEATIKRYCLDRGGKQTVIAHFDGGDADAVMSQAADALREDDRIASVETETRQEAYERFKELFANQPELVEIARPEALPASVTLLPADDVHPGDLADAVTAAYPAIDSVSAGCELPQ